MIFFGFFLHSWLAMASIFSDFSADFLIPKPNILIGGDVMLSRGVGANLKRFGQDFLTKNYHPFENESKNSLILLNLESPFSFDDKDKNERTFLFASNPKNIEVLKWLQQDKILVISLANNHIFNAGFDGFETTLKTLKQAKIHSVGLSVDERQDFLVLQTSGRKFCIGGYSYDGREYFDKKSQKKYFVNSLHDAEKDIITMNWHDCDEKIFLLHWGAEYLREPSPSQKKLAHFLIDNGATLIVGSHSHIFGKVEKYRGKMIFYSLGNFIFDQDWGKKGCEPKMDCVFDKKMEKKVVPTHIGTAGKLEFPYSEAKIWHWEIVGGKLKKRESGDFVFEE